MADPNPYAKYASPPSGDGSNPYAKYAPPPPAGSDDKGGSWWGALGTSLEHGATNLFYGGAQVGTRMGPEEGGAAFTDPADLAARQQTVDTAVKEREQTYRADPSIKAYPKTAWTGNLAGEVAATAPLMVLPGAAPTLPARMVGAGIAAIPIGAARPVTDTEHYGREKTLQVGGEVAAAPVGQVIGETVIAPAAKYVIGWGKWLMQNEEQRAASKAAAEAAKEAAAQEKARTDVTAKFTKAQKGGLVPGDVIKTMTDAEAAKQPMTLMDVDPFPGSPVRRDVGNVYRAPGPAGRELEEFQKGRSYGKDPETLRTWQTGRLHDFFVSVRDKLFSGSARQAIDKLAQQRSDAAKPLWDKAMEGGSLAPLQHQYEQDWNALSKAETAAQQQLREAQTRVTAAQSKQQTSAAAQREAAITPAQTRTREVAEAGKEAVTGARPEPPSPSGYNEELHAATNEMMEAEKRLAWVRKEKEGALSRFQQAQADGSANAKGAVWSRDLQVLLDNPRLRAGLRKGYEIERDKANAARILDPKNARPFDPTEWAIKGFDEEGNPIVGKVPNMRLIQMAKEGLDGLLEDTGGKLGFRDPITRRLTKEGRGIDDLRRALLQEGDRLNPDWKEARKVWAGPSAEIEALADGRHAFDRTADWSEEEVKNLLDKMEPGQRENFKLGAIDKLIQDLDNHRLQSDATSALVNTAAGQRKLRLIMANDAEFKQAMNMITNERTMWQTGTSIMRGAQTAERLATDEQAKEEAAQAVLHASHGLWHFIHGNLMAAAYSMRRAASHIGWGEDPERVNLAKARLYTMPAGHPDLNLRVGPPGHLQIGPEAPPEPSVLPFDASKLQLSEEYLKAAGRGVPGRLPSSMYYSWPGRPPRQ